METLGIKSRFKIIFGSLGLYCFFQILVRFILMGFSINTINSEIFDLIKVFAIGFVYDFLVGLYFISPLAFIALSIKEGLKGWKRYLFITLFVAIAAVTIFTGVCEYYFWEEFQNRFNFIAVDYLVYTHEVIGNIKQSYPMPTLISLTIIISILAALIINKKLELKIAPISVSKRFLFIFLYIIVLIIGTTTLNASLREKASDNIYNQELAGNGAYLFFHAFFNNELDYDRFYVKNDDNKLLLDNLRKVVSVDGSDFIDEKSIYRKVVNDNELSGKKPNIVVLMVESLSSKYFGVYGSKESWTPCLDKLALDSYWFSNVYAIGTRTVRGLESLTLNVPPTPGQSIVRRPECHNLFTAGTSLRKEGYKTQFLYGGYGYFDNMNSYCSGNGYEVRDRTDIPSDKIFFDTIWGVADEILFDFSLKELDKSFEENKPTMQLILTTTNHRPFVFPEGKVANAPQKKREGVVRYTDWAIMKFINDAKTKPWFDNTIFVITADHNAGVAGSVNLPVSKYKIPCFIYAPKLIKPSKNERLMSQIDIMPTLMGLIGLSYETKNMGYDINKIPLGAERVFISTYQLLGYIRNDKLIVLEPQQKAKTYKINNFDENDYSLIENDSELVDEAITWYQGASYLYRNGLLKEIEK